MPAKKASAVRCESSLRRGILHNALQLGQVIDGRRPDQQRDGIRHVAQDDWQGREPGNQLRQRIHEHAHGCHLSGDHSETCAQRLRRHEPLPAAQAYPAYVAWLALNGSRADVALAFLANLAAWGDNCARMAGALRGRHDTAFFAHLLQEQGARRTGGDKGGLDADELRDFGPNFVVQVEDVDEVE